MRVSAGQKIFTGLVPVVAALSLAACSPAAAACDEAAVAAVDAHLDIDMACAEAAELAN